MLYLLTFYRELSLTSKWWTSMFIYFAYEGDKVWFCYVKPCWDSPGWLAYRWLYWYFCRSAPTQDKELPKLFRGLVHRCMGNYDRQNNTFTCVSVRLASRYEQKNSQEAIRASDDEMTQLVESLSEIWAVAQADNCGAPHTDVCHHGNRRHALWFSNLDFRPFNLSLIWLSAP